MLLIAVSVLFPCCSCLLLAGGGTSRAKNASKARGKLEMRCNIMDGRRRAHAKERQVYAMAMYVLWGVLLRKSRGRKKTGRDANADQNTMELKPSS